MVKVRFWQSPNLQKWDALVPSHGLIILKVKMRDEIRSAAGSMDNDSNDMKDIVRTL